MVALKPTNDLSPLDSIFDHVPDPKPVDKFPPPSMNNVVVNPMTCAMVDCGDTSSSGIDRMVECLADIKAVKANLEETRKRVERALEGLCDKTKKGNTHHLIGDKYNLTIEYPGRSFNNSGLKKVWNALSDQIRLAVDGGEVEQAKRIAVMRDKFLRITEISVNLKDFSMYDGADAVPPEYDEILEKIGSLEEPRGWPYFKLPEKEGEKLGSDSAIIVQKI